MSVDFVYNFDLAICYVSGQKRKKTLQGMGLQDNHYKLWICNEITSRSTTVRNDLTRKRKRKRLKACRKTDQKSKKISDAY